MASFFQTAPELSNQFLSDHLLQNYLKRKFSAREYKEIFEDLEKFGKRVITDILEMAIEAEDVKPILEQFDAWGNRIDEIKMPEAWYKLDRVSAEEGIVSHGYQRKYGKNSRLYQLSKLYLFHASSAFYSCPLAMTDGAARLLEIYGDEELKKEAFESIISMDPKKFWTSGQWMTEKIGGSDVSQSETVARFEAGHWRLYGVKWFTSATTSQMTMALARIEENGKIIEGSKGLSLFYIKLRDENGKLNHIEIMRLKNKLGTDALPTAELRLNGTVAQLVGEQGQGVKTISSLFNITRIYNAICTISAHRRAFVLAKDYAQKRIAFKAKIIDHPLHAEMLVKSETDLWAQSLLTFFVAELLGADECQEDYNQIIKHVDVSKALRLLTPIAKLYTAKITLKNTTELVESFGGAGYIENTRIPRLLRDAQVFPIWEGTTNILSLDVLRSIAKEDTLPSLVKILQNKLELIDKNLFEVQFSKLVSSMQLLQNYFNTTKPEEFEYNARNIAFALANLTCGTLLLEFASQDVSDKKAQIMAKRFMQRTLVELNYEVLNRHQENLSCLK